MRVSSIPQIYRHLNRWREILSVLSKYELAAWIGRLGPDFAKDLLKARGGTPIARHPWKTRLRLALAELGPTFIKLGQVLSTRGDLVGVELATELQQLQTNVPADSPKVVRATIEAELGCPIEEVFAEFDDEPLASASIGQVHRARLSAAGSEGRSAAGSEGRSAAGSEGRCAAGSEGRCCGEAVVVKVQHADIVNKIKTDLDILGGLAHLSQRIPEFVNYRPEAIVAEFKRTLRRELDFGREERNMQQFASDFRGNPTVHVPHTFPKLCTARVLTMELVEGIKLSETERLGNYGYDPAEIARRGANLYLEMIFSHGFYHADPHPGNIVILDGNVVGLLDFGMVGRIDEQLHEQFAEMLVAVGNRDAEHLTAIITRVGTVPPGMDRSGLCADVADFVAHYSGLSLERFDLSGALNEMTEMIRRYQIMLPARIAMLLKVLVTLEGTSRLVDADFSLIEVMAPYRKKMLWRRFSPRRRLRKLRRLVTEVEHLVEILPRGIIDILEQVQTGKFDVHLDHHGLEPSVNRLVLGMLASALFLGSAVLQSQHVAIITWPQLLHGMSAPGAAGFAISIFLGLRLWRAIKKSGRLDSRK